MTREVAVAMIRDLSQWQCPTQSSVSMCGVNYKEVFYLLRAKPFESVVHVSGCMKLH